MVAVAGTGSVTIQDINIKSPTITVDEITETSFRIKIEDINTGLEGIKYNYYINDKKIKENTDSKIETVTNLDVTQSYNIRVELIYNENIISSNRVIIVLSDYSDRIKEVLDYPIMTSKGMVNEKLINPENPNDYLYGLDLNKDCTAPDALDKAAYDGNENTYYDSTSTKNKFYYGDDIDIYNVCFKIESSVSRIVYAAVNSSGYIAINEGKILNNGYFHTTYYGKGTTAWKNNLTQLCTTTYEILYDENIK